MDRMSWIGLRSEREFLTLRTRHPHVHYTSDIAYAAPEILFGGGMTWRGKRSGRSPSFPRPSVS